jgi:hypothetical protein
MINHNYIIQILELDCLNIGDLDFTDFTGLQTFTAVKSVILWP